MYCMEEKNDTKPALHSLAVNQSPYFARLRWQPMRLVLLLLLRSMTMTRRGWPCLLPVPHPLERTLHESLLLPCTVAPLIRAFRCYRVGPQFHEVKTGQERTEGLFSAASLGSQDSFSVCTVCVRTAQRNGPLSQKYVRKYRYETKPFTAPPWCGCGRGFDRLPGLSWEMQWKMTHTETSFYDSSYHTTVVLLI